MATVIETFRRGSGAQKALDGVMELLPARLCEELSALPAATGRVEELRVRCGRCASVTVQGKNILLRTALTRSEMDALMLAVCQGSLYAHRDTILQGYVTMQGGVRVGICGRASVDERKMIGVYDVGSMNFRFPKAFGHMGAPVARLLREGAADGAGVLIYSPPGEGKTTLLRSVAEQMAGGAAPLRVAVVDTRGELACFEGERRLTLDVLSGYPKAEGIEIAARTMNAQLIVCDEIGDVREAAAIAAAQNCGVPFLASAHAGQVQGLLRREAIRLLHVARIFGWYVGIRRRPGGGEFDYTVTPWEVADGDMQNTGGGDAGPQRDRDGEGS